MDILCSFSNPNGDWNLIGSWFGRMAEPEGGMSKIGLREEGFKASDQLRLTPNILPPLCVTP